MKGTNLFNIGIIESYDEAAKRLYRYVNGLSIFFGLTALSTAVLLFCFKSNTAPMLALEIIQGATALLYFSNIILNLYHKINLSRKSVIYIFELNFFTLILLGQAWNSPLILALFLYPLLAALVQERLTKHIIIGMVQLLGCLGAVYLLPFLLNKFEGISGFLNPLKEVININCLVYFSVLAAFIIKISYDQITRAGEAEISMIKTQKILLDEISSSQDIIKKEKMVARKVLDSVIPKEFPKTDLIKFHGVYIPRDNVGGDYYDVFSINKNKIGLVMANVCEQGISAATITMMIKAALHSLSDAHLKPSHIIQKMNDTLYDTIDFIGNYITLFYGIIDLDKLTLDYTSAGHNTAYIIHEDGKLQALSTVDTVIGVIKNNSYTSNEVSLKKLQKIVLFSSGIPEAKNSKNENYSKEKLVDVLVNNITLDAKDLSQKVVDELKKFVGVNTYSDDVSIMVAEVVNDRKVDKIYSKALGCFEQDDYEEAKDLLLGLGENKYDKKVQFNILYLLGLTCYQQKEFDESLSYFERAHAVKPEDSFASVITQNLKKNKELHPDLLTLKR